MLFRSLFQLCDAAAGGRGVRVEEIFSFTQDDLCDDDVMLLDAGNAVFLWIGRGATANEKEEADALAVRYVASAAAADGRDADTPVPQGTLSLTTLRFMTLA